MDLLEFRRRVPCHYIETYGNTAEPGRKGRPSLKGNLDSRHDGMNHTIVKQGKQTLSPMSQKYRFSM